MLIQMAQLNPTVGALAGNVDQIAQAWQQGRARGAHLVITPELAVTGYPPRDLLNRPSFVQDSLLALKSLVARTAPGPTSPDAPSTAAAPTSDETAATEVHGDGPVLVVGAVVGSNRSDPFDSSAGIANGAVVIADGKIVAVHHKNLLPIYDVFDEQRYFAAGDQATVFHMPGAGPIGLSVCEDLWADLNPADTAAPLAYGRDPLAALVDGGAQLLINLSASPYALGKPQVRLARLQSLAKRYSRPIVYVNQVGGNDALLFDGGSAAVNPDGSVVGCAPAAQQSTGYVSFSETGLAAASKATDKVGPTAGKLALDLDLDLDPEVAEVVPAIDVLCMGIRDYLHKCGFHEVVLGLSGGIDSALVAALAVRALGADKVTALAMPSRYSSGGSVADAEALAEATGIALHQVPIEPMFAAYIQALTAPLAAAPTGLTEENLQARIRGGLLMAHANATGALLLTTGNKSELAVGYCTLYGDMCGGLAVISDLYKGQVYAMARAINGVAQAEGGVAPIPESTITKPPSAELRPDQTDQDSLPPYDVLDAVLAAYIDRGLGVSQIESDLAGVADRALIQRIVGMVDRAEYKRRQMPPGLRLSGKAFGEGRRLPIAQGYRH